MSNQQQSQVKSMTSTMVVSGLFGVAYLIGAIVWATGATGDDQYGLFLVGFSLDAMLFISATVGMLVKKHNLGTGLMIAGGILSLPVGLIAIIFAVIVRKRLRKASMIPADLKQPVK